ncbi:endonuclease domain-containing protein [Actinopolyspora halophila]|uniref:endonuclease domain-containing protein n=1 Tax=Actinopolyspora halophila TaxID=1850 RepID=UPI000363C12E|nr:endonuclease domain-containing protein [Actinopolyspora halophila]
MKKRCRTCSRTLDHTEFYKNASGGNFRCDCKTCYNAACTMRARARRYGLTVDEMLELVTDAQCEICGDTPDGVEIDHSHATGVMRGVLCGLCNSGIAFFRDDPVLLRAAAKYLTHSRHR